MASCDNVGERLREAESALEAIGKKPHPHQVEGIRWMMEHEARGNGALLADDPGCGKTYQALSLVATSAPATSTLVVVPTCIIEQWAGAAIAGPKSRNLLKLMFPDLDVSNEGLPFMGFKEANLFNVPARIFRISFSGELAYEVNVPSDYGNFMWNKIIEFGKTLNIQPYGTEALSTLRIEMGHVAGSEVDGRTIPYDNGLDGLVSKKKDFIGKRSLTRKAFIAEDRQRIVAPNTYFR